MCQWGQHGLPRMNFPRGYIHNTLEHRTFNNPQGIVAFTCVSHRTYSELGRFAVGNETVCKHLCLGCKCTHPQDLKTTTDPQKRLRVSFILESGAGAPNVLPRRSGGVTFYQQQEPSRLSGKGEGHRNK